MTENNHISIVISTRNAGKYIDACLLSALGQEYPDFEIVFIDACSTDDTWEKAQAHKDPRLRLFRNETRKFQGENIKIGAGESQPNSIVVTLDGDDWFPHENVLTKVNEIYNETGCWMSYGRYEEYPYRDVSSYYNEYPLNVRRGKTFRQVGWQASHLRTFRRELFLKIDPDDLKDPTTGDYVSMAADFSFQFPMLEMCGETHSQFIPDILYVYNRDNPENEAKINQAEIDRIEKMIRSKPLYPTLESL